MSDPSVKAHVSKFEACRPLYEGFRLQIHDLLGRILHHENIDVIDVQSRVKEIASLEEKILRKGENYQDPLNDITDLVGLRIIVYYQADAERVDDIIRTNFEVDQLNTYRRSDTLADEQFGYLSNHYVVAMDEPRRSLPEWSLYTRMKAEIQVRTALQHAWAAVDHKMNYKATADIPSPVRRKMAMLSAIFELADEQFGLLREQRLQVREDYSTAVREASMDLPLDDTSISLLLEDEEVIEIIGEALRDASKQTWFSLHGNHVPEAVNTEENSAKGRSELLTLLRNVNIRSLSQLQVLLTSDRAKSIMIIRSLNVHDEYDEHSRYRCVPCRCDLAAGAT